MDTANKSLPVLEFRQTIIDAVADNSVTVITAETGAGKSTQVPRFLAEAGYRVVVTQPRRLAARTLAQRVAEEMGTRLGDRVGYRTAEERSDSAATEVLFVTDGLQLVRELAGVGGTGRKTVLVLDEVHEWNLNMEVLVAWCRQRVSAGDDLRVVLMSATLDAERLSQFFGAAPIISVPGRLYPVERSYVSDGRKLVETAVALAKAGRNVLVFQPGKREIAEAVSKLQQELGASALVLPLHGEVEPAEQARCFAPAGGGRVKVVVATNVAQTSVTIPDIDAVVDSGIERRVELVDGIEGLYLRPISQADCSQRAGRAGRTKPGVYVLCSETSMTNRPEFPVAEVLRSRLDQLVLRLAVQGFDATALKFFHQPDVAVLADGKRTLQALGAMSADGTVTKIGRKMARLPVAVQYARMLIEAESRGVVDAVATIAACLEAGEIRGKDGQWKSLTRETKSDLLAVLDVYDAARQIKGGGDALRNAGVFAKDFFRAGELRRKLVDAVRDSVRSESKRFASKEEEREQILRACVAGLVDHLYQGGGGTYRNGDRVDRQLARESVVTGGGQWLVGLPKDIEIETRRGKMTLRLVTMASAVDPSWLLEVAPQLASETTGLNPRFDQTKDCVVSTTQKFFNGRLVADVTVDSPEHPQAAQVFATWLAGRSELTGTHLDATLRANAERQKRAGELNVRSGESTFQVYSSSEIAELYTVALAGARCVAEVRNVAAFALPSLDETTVASVVRENPDTIEILCEQLAVEYRAPYYSTVYAPRVKLTDEMVTSNSWTRLPDEGVRLPGGRSVEVVVSCGYYTTFTNTNILSLKAKVREHLNKQQWENWRDRPEIAVPDTTEAEAVSIPEIIEVSYGTSVVDGSVLVGYGVVVVNVSRWSVSDPYFTGQWFQSQAEAQAAHAASVTKLQELRIEIAEKHEIAQLRADAEALSKAFGCITDRDEWRFVEYEVRDRVYPYTILNRIPSGAAELRQWIVAGAEVKSDVDRLVAEWDRASMQEATRLEQIKDVLLSMIPAHPVLFQDQARVREVVVAWQPSAKEVFGGSVEGQLLTSDSGLLNTVHLWNAAGISQNETRTGVGRVYVVKTWARHAIEGGVVELTSFEKWGGINLGVRFVGVAPIVATAVSGGAGGSAFTFKCDRHYICTCGIVTKLGNPEWNLFRNTGRTPIRCESCGTQGEVTAEMSKRSEKVATASTPAPTPTAEKTQSAADLRAALVAKFGKR